MKTLLKEKKITNEYRILIFQYIPITFVVILLFLMLLKFPQITTKGISNGIELCFSAIIPSLYPFMVLSSFFVNYNLCDFFEKIFTIPCRKIFSLNGKCAPVILFSMISGLPVGGKMTLNLYEKGLITQNEGKRLLLFCICPGPAFIITTVGYGMLNSKRAGLLIFVSVIAANIFVGIFSRFFADKDIKYYENTKPQLNTFSESLVKSVNEGSINMLIVCAWVILFSCLINMIDNFSISSGSKMFLYGILEITNGCYFTSSSVPIPIISGIIAFSGICGHFQIMSAMVKLRLKYKYFLASRVVAMGVSVLICNMLIKIFPITEDVLFIGNKPQYFDTGISKTTSFCMLVMCVLFLIGDSFKIKLNKA